MKLTNLDFIKRVKELIGNDYTFLDKYDGTHIKLQVLHNVCGNKYKVSPNKFLTGRRCPKCANKRNSERIFLGEEVFLKEIVELVGNEYNVLEPYIGTNEKILFKHNAEKCGNLEFYQTPNLFKSGKRCNVCSGKHITDHSFKYDFYQKYGNKKFEIIGNYFNGIKPIDRGTKINIKCKRCNYVFAVTLRHLRLTSSGLFCNSCESRSGGELLIEEYLNSENILHYRNFTDENCIRIRSLEFDFKIPFTDGSFAYIEFDGKQHFEPTKNEIFGNFEVIKERDKIKDDYCKESNIPLLRIHYKQYKNIANLIKNFLESI